jgi:hypothetical protein
MSTKGVKGTNTTDNALIFLDVDGVLNIQSKSYITSTFKKDGSMKYLEYHLVQRLNYIMEKTNSKLVISSSWKSDMDSLLSELKTEGFKYAHRIIGITPYREHRGIEIEDYLSLYPKQTYIVLDDEIEDICGEKCNVVPKENVLEIDMNQGLSENNVQYIIETLNKKGLKNDKIYHI